MAEPPDFASVRLNPRRLEDEFGLPFLAFMLHVSEGQISDRLRRNQPLDGSREAVLTELAVVATRAFPQDSHGGYSILPSVMLGYNEHLKTVAVNAYRERVGGTVPPLTRKEGTLERSLEQLARDCYPAALLPPTLPGRPTIPGRLEHLSTVIHRHPLRETFETQVIKDKTLAPLFPNYDDSGGHSGSYYTNLGYGGGIQLWLLAEGMINAAHSALSLDGKVSHQAVVDRAVESLGSLRKLLSGKGVKTKARIGMAGIKISEPLETPWGVLRPATEEETARVRSGAATATEVVLEVPVQLKLFLGTGLPADGEEGPGHFGKVSTKLHEDLNQRWTKLALAVFLGVEREQTIVTTHSWTIFDEFFSGTAGMSFSLVPSMGVWALEPQEIANVSKWAELIEKHYHRSITVAADRIVKAGAHRPDPADGLIDAVIALENLFGTSSAQGEVTFRVSSGCAWLLEKEPDKRRELRKEVRAIYDERSKIVHGNAPSQDAWQKRDRAILLVRRSLQTLLHDRPDLISNRDRSSELTLGA